MAVLKPDWNQNQQYYWNNHHYGWFNGGWLIIDNGFWPYGYPYPAWYNPNPIYYSGNSMVANVQGSSIARSRKKSSCSFPSFQ